MSTVQANVDSGRNINADLIKAFSILAVVAIHASFPREGQAIWEPDLMGFARLAVPAFIVIFAYFLEISVSKNRSKNIVSKITPLLRIYVFWTAVYYFPFVDWSSIPFSKAFTAYWTGYGWPGQYFLLILIQLILVFPLLRSFASNTIVFYGALVLTLFAFLVFETMGDRIPQLIQKMGYRPIFYWLFYAMLGVRMARGQVKAFPLLALFSVFLIPAEYLIVKFVNIEKFAYLHLSILISTFLILPWLMSSSRAFGFVPKKIAKYLTFVGRETLPIYVINPLVISSLRGYIEWPLETSSEAVKIFTWLLYVILTVLISLMAAKLIRKIGFTQLLG